MSDADPANDWVAVRKGDKVERFGEVVVGVA